MDGVPANETVRMSNDISAPPPDTENWHTHRA
jgi:hypothetical protein